MKKILNSKIFIFLLGFVIASAIGVYAINAGEIDYKNTNVESALDTLYTNANKDLTFGNIQVSRSMGHMLALGDRTVDISLDKGKYLVTLIWNAAYDSNNTDDRNGIHTIEYCTNKLSCTNNCNINSLGGQRSLASPENSNSANKYKISGVLTCEYYVNVDTDNTILTGIENMWSHGEASENVENLMISAIPVIK